MIESVGGFSQIPGAPGPDGVASFCSLVGGIVMWVFILPNAHISFKNLCCPHQGASRTKVDIDKYIQKE
jgi:hypothetical protein